ncbi:MAG: hypothetical protein MSK63_07340 [Clostridiales bacterium]|nr:hypothetical protein [Clostridiales bacterium]
MERLTNCAQGYCEMYCKKYMLCFEDPEDCTFKDEIKLYDAIKSIEGIVPFDRLLELAVADKAGRLVVLPWAAGDVIYKADPAHGVVKHTFAGEPAWMMHSYAVDDAGNEWYDGWGSSDETPFYKTREEAEAALKGGDG